MLRNLLFGSVVSILFLSCYSDTAAPTDQIQAFLLKKDFEILRKTLEEAHPGLYMYSDQATLDRYFDSIDASIDHDMTSLEFFKKLLPVVAAVRCSHTNLKLPEGSSIFRLHKSLPFDFFVDSSGMYIIRDYSNNHLAGSRVVGISRKPVDSIIKELLFCIPADGFNQSFKFQILSKGAFREGYALFYGQPDSFLLAVKPQQSKSERLIKVAAVSNKTFLTSEEPAIEVHFKNSVTAVLTINSFAINAGKFHDTVSQIFRTFKEKNIRNLIIDLRKNGGGNNDNVGELFSHIAAESFFHLKRAEMNPLPFAYLNYAKNPEAFRNLQGVPDTGGKLLMNYRYAGAVMRSPAIKNIFTGKVIVLCSGYTSSAASEFVILAHETRRAVIVGEETSGCYYGATGGNFIELILPESKLQVRIPTIRIYTAVAEDYLSQPKGRGVVPDYKIAPTVLDLIKGKDVQMERAVEITGDR
jgi:hypothetical protein